MLTRKLRDKGTMLGKIVIDDKSSIDFADPNQIDLVKEVSVKEPVEYSAGTKKIILVDCGTKNNIIRAFLGRNISVIEFLMIMTLRLSSKWNNAFKWSRRSEDNVATIKHTRKAMETNIPILGICLGSQILALAAGADTIN